MIFNNPEKHNAVSLDMEATIGIIEEFAGDDVRVVVLVGAGDKAFVSGADISKFETSAPSEEAVRAQRGDFEGTYSAFRGLPEADHRHDPRLLHRRRLGLAGACCDLRICTDVRKVRRPAAQARARLPLYRVCAAWSTWWVRPSPRRFSHRAPVRRAEAQIMGLVNRVVPLATWRNTSRTTPTPSPATRR